MSGSGGGGKSEAVVIDTTGSFSPLRLRDVIVERMGGGSTDRGVRKKSREMVEEEAMRMLDRVRIMRVFDLAGVLEAVSEIIGIWEVHERETAERREKVRRMEWGIASSQDGEEEEESVKNLLRESGEEGREMEEEEKGCITMIIIDNITNVVNAEISKSQVRGKLPISPMRS